MSTMPLTNKPNTTDIQNIFNDILLIKEKIYKGTRTCDDEEKSTKNEISNVEIKAVNGHQISDRINASLTNVDQTIISSLLLSGGGELNGQEVEAEYQYPNNCDNKLFSNDQISEPSAKEKFFLTKDNLEQAMVVTQNTQPILHSNSGSGNESSETEDYFDRESISTNSLSWSPSLSKKTIPLNSTTKIGLNHHIAISSGDEDVLASETSDFETIDSNNEESEPLATKINNAEKSHEQDETSFVRPVQDFSEFETDLSRVIDENIATAFPNPTTATTISSWLSRVQSCGFPADVLRRYINEDISYEDVDETWWDPKLVRIFDPYYDISPEEIDKVIDGKTNLNGEPVGQCTLQLCNGDEVYGNFRKGVRQVTVLNSTNI